MSVRLVFPKKSLRSEKIINRCKAGVLHMFRKNMEVASAIRKPTVCKYD